MGFIAIAGLSLCSALLSLIVINKIENGHTEISTSALPILLVSDRISQDAFEIAELANQLIQADNLETLDRISGQIENREDDIEASVLNLDSADAKELFQNVFNTLSQLRLILQQTEAVSRQTFNLRTEFRQSLELARLPIRDLSNQSKARQTELGLGITHPMSNETMDILSEMRRQNVIAGAIENMEDGLDRLQVTSLPTDISRIQAEISFNLQEMFTAISRLDDTQYGQQLSDASIQFYDTLQELDPFQARLRLLESEENKDALLSQTLDLIGLLKTQTTQINEFQGERVAALDQRLLRLSNISIFIMISAATIAALVSILFIFVVVERQINRRLIDLSKNVEQISNDNLNPQPSIPGSDEIGKLGTSIEKLRRMTLQHRLMEQKLVEAKTEAEQSERVKSDFLAMMSHEVRTPLNTIMGLFQLIAIGGDAQKNAERAQVGIRASRRLSQQLTDIIDMTRLEAGSIECDIMHLAIRPMMASWRTRLEARVAAEEKPIKIIVEINDDVPEFVLADEYRLDQVFNNLMDNAIKFTDVGTITIGASVVHLPHGPKLKLFINDTGTGISKDKFDLVFQRFQQEDTTVTRKYGGSGLGLTISRDLCHLMDMQLEIEEKTGEGAKFVIYSTSVPREKAISA
ncbi:ATP-binding protein [Pseudaestuariivita rosea]|uniref:ATP-binding protein n=1 Tax=Pseudaestuariivita rosea TaxID=2763263 RepID=UPI001ABA70BA|nr:ATP-binding protein [Pseudaestuariivita rosea]